MDCPSGCFSGEGSLLALLISAADGLETWPLSAKEHPVHRSPSPVSVLIIKHQSADQPKVSMLGGERGVSTCHMDGWLSLPPPVCQYGYTIYSAVIMWY